MKTILKGTGNEIIIDNSGEVKIIGESINPTRRKKLVSELSEGKFDYVVELAQNQIDDGADILDVNVGFPGVDDVSLLPQTVIRLQERFEIPLCLDSPNPKALEAALKVYKGKCLINSVNGEEESMKNILPIIREYGAAVIGLTMDDNGITHDPEERLKIAGKILERAVKYGIKEEDVVIDPLAMAVSADPGAAMVTLETISLVNRKLGLNITQGASNISFGLPGREVLNSAFMAMSIKEGLSCPIANPSKITAIVRAANLLLGRDDFAINFIGHFQG